MYDAVVLADSISPHGYRLTTLMCVIPRIILSELNTHRDFSRNSASTRAIPLGKQIRNVMETPFVPQTFGVNRPGMQHSEVLTGEEAAMARKIWLRGRDRAVTEVLELVLGDELMAKIFSYEPSQEFVPGYILSSRLDELETLIPKSNDRDYARSMGMLNVHKQLAGRPLETYMWQVVIVTATEFENFFALRDHPDAQGEIATVASLMRKAINGSKPELVGEGEWHTPLVSKGEFDDIADALRASVARTAAVSYRRHNVIHGLTSSEEERLAFIQRELNRHDGLLKDHHMSPFEHQATPMTQREVKYRQALQQQAFHIGTRKGVQQLHIDHVKKSLEFLGNVRGWTQYRKTLPNESNFGKVR